MLPYTNLFVLVVVRWQSDCIPEPVYIVHITDKSSLILHICAGSSCNRLGLFVQLCCCGAICVHNTITVASETSQYLLQLYSLHQTEIDRFDMILFFFFTAQLSSQSLEMMLWFTAY